MNQNFSEVTDFLDEMKAKAYADPMSILKEFDEFLLENGIKRTYDSELLFNNVSGRSELCDGLRAILEKAGYENERNFLIQTLYSSGCDKAYLIRQIVALSKVCSEEMDFYDLAWILRSIADMEFVDDYIEIVKNVKLSSGRKPVIDMLGNSDLTEVEVVLTQLLADKEVASAAAMSLRRITLRKRRG